jgi:hypothetical protein
MRSSVAIRPCCRPWPCGNTRIQTSNNAHHRRRPTPSATKWPGVSACLSARQQPARQSLYSSSVVNPPPLRRDGFAVGPDLAGARSGGKEKLLVNILTPNREVPLNYFGYVVETKEGKATPADRERNRQQRHSRQPSASRWSSRVRDREDAAPFETRPCRKGW